MAERARDLSFACRLCPMESVNVGADMVLDDEIGDIVSVTFGGTSWQLSIWATPARWDRLAEVPRIASNERADFRLGTAMGLEVWWHVTDDALMLTVGAPEDFSMGFVLPTSVLGDIPGAIRDVIDEGWDNAG